MNRMGRALVGVTALALMVLATGCEKKLTYKRFQMVREGYATHMDVEQTLGEPNQKAGDVWSWQDFDRHITCNVYFDGKGVVDKKEWIDATKGQWEGSAPGVEESAGSGDSSEQGSSSERTIIRTYDVP